jgi:hypothetical protein
MKNSFTSPRVAAGLAVVVQHDLRHALHEHEVVGLLLVVVPALDDARVDDRQVHLTELLEDCRRRRAASP